MKKILLFLVITLSTSPLLFSQEVRTDWFQDAKFGIFVHWGLYSLIGYNEWCMNHYQIEPHEYEKLAEKFDPQNFDPDEWAELFQKSGAKYVVITSKHHEGFCLFDSKYTDYSIMNNHYGKDIIGMLAESVKSRNIKYGIYYSIMDWHHPDYLPRRYFDDRPAENAEINIYKDFFKNQVGELIDNYDPAILWFDAEWENTHDSLETVELIAMIKEKSPNLIFNNRLSNFIDGDFKTPERYVPATGLKDKSGNQVIWETCQTMGGNWGYDPFMNHYFSERDLIRMLIDAVSKGGNFLLNIGPKPDGTIQEEFITRLLAIGDWLEINGESIYETNASIFEKLSFFGKSTTKNNIVYLHVFSTNDENILKLPELTNVIKEISLLATGEVLSFQIKNNQIQINLPDELPDINASVIKLELIGKPEVESYIPKYNMGESIELDSYSAELIPVEDNSLKLYQDYKNIVLTNWTDENKHIKIKWDFDFNKWARYKIYGYLTEKNLLQGEIKILISNGKETIEASAPDMPRWTSLAQMFYQPVELGIIDLEAGRNSIILTAPEISAKQELIFEKLVLEPVKTRGEK